MAQEQTALPGAVPPAVESALSSVGPGRHTLSDGSVWVKLPDGTIQLEEVFRFEAERQDRAPALSAIPPPEPSDLRGPDAEQLPETTLEGLKTDLDAPMRPRGLVRGLEDAAAAGMLAAVASNPASLGTLVPAGGAVGLANLLAEMFKGSGLERGVDDFTELMAGTQTQRAVDQGIPPIAFRDPTGRMDAEGFDTINPAFDGDLDRQADEIIAAMLEGGEEGGALALMGKAFDVGGTLVQMGGVRIKQAVLRWSARTAQDVANAFKIRPERAQQFIGEILARRGLHPRQTADLSTTDVITRLDRAKGALIDDVMGNAPVSPQTALRQATRNIQAGPLGSQINRADDLSQVDDILSQTRADPRFTRPVTQTREVPRSLTPDEQLSGVFPTHPTETVTSTRLAPRSLTARQMETARRGTQAAGKLKFGEGQAVPAEVDKTTALAFRDAIERTFRKLMNSRTGGGRPATLEHVTGSLAHRAAGSPAAADTLSALNRRQSQELVLRRILRESMGRAEQQAITNIPQALGIQRFMQSGDPSLGVVASLSRPVGSHIGQQLFNVGTVARSGAPGVAADLTGGEDSAAMLLRELGADAFHALFTPTHPLTGARIRRP